MRKLTPSLMFRTMLLFSLLLGLAPAAPARAQSGPSVRITPPYSSIRSGEQGTLTLEVSGGEAVNAFDVTFTYDPAVLSLESWSYGNYLSNLARVYLDNRPGFFRLAATQLATPGVSGDGVLLNLTFRGLAEGNSPILLKQLQFADAQGNPMEPVRVDGSLAVLPLEPTQASQPANRYYLPAISVPTPGPSMAGLPSPTASRTPATNSTSAQSTQAVPAQNLLARTATPHQTATLAAPVQGLTGTGTTPARSTAIQNTPGVQATTQGTRHNLAGDTESAVQANVPLGDSGQPLFSSFGMEQVMWVILALCVGLTLWMLGALIKRRKKRKLLNRKNEK